MIVCACVYTNARMHVCTSKSDVYTITRVGVTARDVSLTCPPLQQNVPFVRARGYDRCAPPPAER